MPLRDHFRPPLDRRARWTSLHAMWPTLMLQQLFPKLPPGYRAAPGVYVEAGFEVDPAAHTDDEPEPPGGGAGVATQPALVPSLSVDIDVPDQDEFEYRVYDPDDNLVAVVELVSPANKDRAETRAAFVAKCVALLEQGVCVSMVDVVTTRPANLYVELLEQVGRTDPAADADRSHLYAVTHRWLRAPKRRTRAESWYHPLALGGRLPELPLWLADNLPVMLDLEASYEETCRYLHIT
ncbi:MAG: DUF4058 family protein [Gemmataceae bacterium]